MGCQGSCAKSKELLKHMVDDGAALKQDMTAWLERSASRLLVALSLSEFLAGSGAPLSGDNAKAKMPRPLTTNGWLRQPLVAGEGLSGNYPI